MALDIQKEIDRIRQHPELGKYLATALERIEKACNVLGTNTGVDPTGAKLPAPSPIQQFSVKSDGNGTIHGVISDNNEIQRGIHYFVEHSTDPDFTRPTVVHLGASRTMVPLTLPHMDDDGNVINYYFRAFSQYPGSDPGEKIHFGGDTPTAVNAGGAVQMSLFPSTGSGTAQNSGEEGGSGFGKVLFRPATGVKRTSAQ